MQYVVNVPASPFGLVPDDCVRIIPEPKPVVAVGAGPALKMKGPSKNGESAFRRATAWEITSADS